MKKSLLLLMVLVSLSFLASAQLQQGFGLEAYTQNNIKVADPETGDAVIAHKGDYAMVYLTQAKFDNLNIFAEARIFGAKSKQEDATFNVTHSEYTVGAIYTVKKFKFKVSHACFHPVLSDEIPNRNRITGAYTQIGVYWNMNP